MGKAIESGILSADGITAPCCCNNGCQDAVGASCCCGSDTDYGVTTRPEDTAVSSNMFAECGPMTITDFLKLFQVRNIGTPTEPIWVIYTSLGLFTTGDLYAAQVNTEKVVGLDSDKMWELLAAATNEPINQTHIPIISVSKIDGLGTLALKSEISTADISDLDAYMETESGEIILEARSVIQQTATEILATVAENKITSDGQYQELLSALTVQAGQIASKVSQSTYDTDKQASETRFSTIEQTASQIQSTVAANKESADGSISSLQSQITQQAGLIATKVSQTDYAADNTTRETRFSTIEQTAEGLTTRVADIEEEFGEGGRITEAETSIEQNAQAIALKASQSSVDTLSGQVQQNAAAIVIANNQIATKVSQSAYDTDKQSAESRMSLIEQDAIGIHQSVSGLDGKIDTRAQELTTYIDTIEGDLQRQIDGAIETYKAEGAPTLNNYPASEWDQSEYDAHVGDLYYDTANGYAYRFAESSGVYSWELIRDTGITEAIATANDKGKIFITQPVPPYKVGDLWAQGHTSTNDGALYRCIVSRDSGSFDASDWEIAYDYESIKISRANFDIFSNLILGTVAQYDASGNITSATWSQFQQGLGGISLMVFGQNGGFRQTGIDIADHTVTIMADNFVIKNTNGTRTLSLAVDGNGLPLIAASNLEINGIFSTTPGSTWMTLRGNILSTAQGYADSAEGNANNYADSVGATTLQSSKDYFNNNVLPGINSSISGLSTRMGTAETDISNLATRVADAEGGLSDLGYLAAALLDGSTTVAGGLILSSLIQLGSNTGSGDAWQVWSGINGVYNSSAYGGGIAAWYGGDMLDRYYSDNTDANRAAKTLFRQDGSGYIASNNLWWGASGDLHINGSTIIDQSGNVTLSNIAQIVAQLSSWFEVVTETRGGTQFSYLKLNTSSTGLRGFATDGFISAFGASDTGSGGGGIDLSAMWANLQVNESGTTGYNLQINPGHLTTALGTYVNAITTTGSGNAITAVSKDGSTLTFTKGSSYLPLSGGTLTGHLYLSSAQIYIKNSDTAILTGTTSTSSAAGTSTIGQARGTTTIRGFDDPIWRRYTNNGQHTDYTIYHSGNLTQSVVTGLIGSSTYAPYNADGYLPLSGGTMTGNITFAKSGSTTVGYPILALSSITGGWSRELYDVRYDDTRIFHIGVYGNASTLSYGFIGTTGYSGNNLRIYSDKVQFGDNVIWHAGNDGASSGLDADLLDGQHGSYYATASSLGNYLPLAGGTMTGSIIFDGGVPRIKFDVDTSRARGIAWLNTSDTTVGQILMHNTAKSIYINATGASDIFNDAVGKYSLKIGQDKLTYNTYSIYHTNNLTKSVVTGLIGSTTYAPYNADGYLPLSGGTMTGSPVLSNAVYLRANNAAGTDLGIMGLNSSDQLLIGYGTAGQGYETHLYGGSIAFHYGTARAIGMTLNSDGQLVKANDTPYAAYDAGGTVRTLLSLSAANAVWIAYGTAGAGYYTHLCGNQIEFKYGTGRTTGMVLTSDGDVTLTNTLCLNNNKTIRWKDTSGNLLQCLQFNSVNRFHVGYGAAVAGYDTYINGNNIYFRYGTTPTNGAIITSDGNVGIGTNSPANKLHVSGGGRFDSNANIWSTISGAQINFNKLSTYTTGYNQGIRFRIADSSNTEISSKYLLGVYSSSAYQYMYLGGTYTDAVVRITDTGVGIMKGNASPSYALDVGGTVAASGLLSANGGITVPSGKSITLGNGVLTWDATNSAWKLTGNLYATGFISAFGASDTGGSGGGGINLAAMWANLQVNDSDTTGYGLQIHPGHLTTALGTYVNAITTAGSGNVVTGITKSGQTLTVTYGSGSGGGGLSIIDLDDNGTTTAGTWLASSSAISAYTDGLMVRYKLTKAGATTTTLNINGLGAKTVYRFNSTKLTTHYAVGSYVILIYNTSLNSGCWITVDGYDSNTNTYVRQYVASDNAEYSLLARYATASVSSYQDNFARFANAVTLNPSKGSISATQFYQNGNRVPNITVSSSAPSASDGEVGDVWIQV